MSALMECVEMTYGEKLSELMELKGFTAPALSTATSGEIAVATINQIKQDLVASPNAHTLNVLAKALDVPLDTFSECLPSKGRVRKKRRR